ncbi:hypothetical protein PIB30_074488 [Stylosanthes scabra]|uniref:Uncharacterized protein n=1 Tax=Stylosanthes scabra TaxID=79078 RepID=A0ABU6RQ32_9FABA|nr:hypothetical protein [Stylosanthes scabra]
MTHTLTRIILAGEITPILVGEETKGREITTNSTTITIPTSLPKTTVFPSTTTFPTFVQSTNNFIDEARVNLKNHGEAIRSWKCKWEKSPSS